MLSWVGNTVTKVKAYANGEDDSVETDSYIANDCDESCSIVTNDSTVSGTMKSALPMVRVSVSQNGIVFENENDQA
eukprot:13674929-Ditylum_brightwellii.AAC.1